MHNIITDSKTELSNAVDELFDDLVGEDGQYRSSSYRYIVCNQLIEGYFEKVGEVPPSNILDRMSTYMLKEDNRPIKGTERTAHEYPMLSEKQYERRIEKEAAFIATETYDSEGINWQPPTRSVRIESELKQRKVK